MIQSFIYSFASSIVRVCKVASIALLVFSASQAVAAPKEYEWEKFGYSSDWFNRAGEGTRIFESPKALCSAAGLSGGMRACPSTEPEISICVLARLPCSEDSDDGTGTA